MKAPRLHPSVGTQYITRSGHRATAEVPSAFLGLKLAGSRVFSLGGAGAEEGQATAGFARSRALTAPRSQIQSEVGSAGQSRTISFPSSGRPARHPWDSHGGLQRADKH